MRLLVAYATTDGQTRKIARFVADLLADQGHAVELLNVEDAGELDLTRFDGAILGGSLHAGGYQKTLRRFVTKARPALDAMPTLFLAVSLSAAGNDPDDWKGLTLCLEEFAEDTGWIPGRIEHVAGAFKFTEYDFFRAWAMRRIAEHKGETVEPGRDKEYTDWAALRLAVDGWVAGLTPRVTAA